jgi:AcrR family transcriptional regulator
MAATRTRTDELLEATCRVVAREGAHGLRMSDVAREAGVSSALLHYYFETKSELLARAFAYAEARVRERSQAMLEGIEPAAARLARLFELTVEDDPVFRENWVIWNEMWSSALFDPDLRPSMAAAYEAWVGRIGDLLRDGREDGSVPEEVDPADAAVRLAAVVDGMGSQVVLGVLGTEQAAEVVAGALALELAPSRRTTRDRA